MLRCLFLCCILMGLATTLNSLSILVVEPLASTSHHVWLMSLVKELLRRGHNVHLVSIHKANIESKLAQNLTSVVFDDMMNDLFKKDDYDPTIWKDYSTYQTVHFLYVWAFQICEEVIKTKAAKELLETVKNTQFDVIVQDITLDECLYGLWEVAKGKPPIVGYIPFGPAAWLKDFTGGSSYPTVRPYCHANLAKPEGFWQRMQNVMYFMVDDLIRHYHYMPLVQQLAKQYVGHEIRPLYEIGRNVSIVLINTYSAFEPGIPLPPNVMEIGGMHAQAAKPVADERIRKFLDGAKDGAVVISLGTNVAWKAIGLEKLKAVVLALSQLKQRVIWKLKTEVPLEMPNNVMVVEWMPQNDILTHKNVKAVWTHGGLLSTHEAIWQGIPVIGMPFFMDQRPNVELLVAKGAGMRLDVEVLSTQTVLDSFEQILYNESYTKNMKRLSNEFRDRPVPPLDLAVWSVEYATRHPPGSLASPIRSQSWVVYNMIDVYAFLFFSFIIILSAVFFTLKFLLNFYYYHIYSASELRKSKQM